MLPGNKHSYLASQSEVRMILPLISPSLYVFLSVTHLNILTPTFAPIFSKIFYYKFSVLLIRKMFVMVTILFAGRLLFLTPLCQKLYLSDILRTNQMWPTLKDRIHEFKIFFPFVFKI